MGNLYGHQPEPLQNGSDLAFTSRGTQRTPEDHQACRREHEKGPCVCFGLGTDFWHEIGTGAGSNTASGAVEEQLPGTRAMAGVSEKIRWELTLSRIPPYESKPRTTDLRP